LSLVTGRPGHPTSRGPYTFSLVGLMVNYTYYSMLSLFASYDDLLTTEEVCHALALRYGRTPRPASDLTGLAR